MGGGDGVEPPLVSVRTMVMKTRSTRDIRAVYTGENKPRITIRGLCKPRTARLNGTKSSFAAYNELFVQAVVV